MERPREQGRVGTEGERARRGERLEERERVVGELDPGEGNERKEEGQVDGRR